MGSMEIDKACLSLRGARLCFEESCYDSFASRRFSAMLQAAPEMSEDGITVHAGGLLTKGRD